MTKEGSVLWLSEISKKDTALVGGKGANLGEMYNSGFPVPQAFAITTKAFHEFLDKTKLTDQIKKILSKIDVDNTEELQKKAKEIREMIIAETLPEDLQKEILEAYDHFNVDLNELKNSPGALAILKSAREPVFVSVRSSATAEDLGGASFAGQQETFINVKGNNELLEKVKKCFASIFTARSIYYRAKKGFESFVGISAIVQRMVNSDKSGVMFSRNPVNQEEKVVIESVFGQGEGIVSGKIKPDSHTLSYDLEILEEEIANKKIAIIRTASGQTKTIQLTPEKSNQKVLKTYELKQLAEYAIKLEKHFDKPQDIEFAIEDDKIFILQTRPITTLEKAGEQQELTGQVLTKGLAASPGIASGVVKIVHDLNELSKVKKGDILVTGMTNPDMVVAMQRATGIITDEGGLTAHAAIVSREMGIPAVVGTQNATEILEDGQEVTVDGFTGKIFLGKTENKKVEIKPIIETKTKIKTLVDLPEFAERAAKTKAYGVGLVRLEGIIAASGKHPLFYKDNNLEDYTKVLKDGLKKIADSFVGKEIWIRTSDIRTDEYSNLEGAPKETEKNPMLGMHGIRFSLKNPEIFKAELSAVKELANQGHKFGLMFPQIISPQEILDAKKILEELGMLNNENIKIGAMIETPASTVLIKDLCETGIQFISFGTNDLTQYTLAIDRGNEDVQYIYDETNWAVLKQISRVIRECHSHSPRIETSICGQAASKKKMVEFLVKQKIDSISVNADIAREMSKFVKALEEGKSFEEADAISKKEDSNPQDTEQNNEKLPSELEEPQNNEIQKENEPIQEPQETTEQEEPQKQNTEETPYQEQNVEAPQIPAQKESDLEQEQLEEIKEYAKEKNDEAFVEPYKKLAEENQNPQEPQNSEDKQNTSGMDIFN